MKALLMTVAMFTAGAQAAKIETCRKEVRKACAGSSYLINHADKMTDGDECKMIQRHLREGSANDYSAERAVFFDKEVLFSVVTSNEGPGEAQVCSFKEINLKNSSFLETKIADGRMYAVTSTGHVAVITRTNSVQWLVNTESGPNQGKRFFDVKDIAIDQKNDLIKLTYKNGIKENVSLKEALDGLNKYKQFVSGGQ